MQRNLNRLLKGAERTIPTTGALSASRINTELGKGSTSKISWNDSGFRMLAGKGSGQVSINDTRGGYTAINVDIRSSNGNNVYINPFPLTNYFPFLPNGTRINITCEIMPPHYWANTPIVTHTFTIGANETKRHGGSGGKNWYMDTTLGGVNLSAHGFYSGSSTNYPNNTMRFTRFKII